jgi:hypothetical protein
VRGKVVATISKQPIRTPTPNHQVVIPTTLKLISTSSAGDAIVPWPADNPIPSFTSADAVTPLLPKDFIGSPESNDDIVASGSADGVVAPRSEDGRLHTEAQHQSSSGSAKGHTLIAVFDGEVNRAWCAFLEGLVGSQGVVGA